MEAPTNHYPLLSPRFWHGMKVSTWWSMLARNRFKMAASRVHIAVGVSLVTPFNDLLAFGQSAVFGRRIARTRLDNPPIFILGHWRSGTTLLHELLVTNPKFASPNTYQCFAPWHFLLSEPWMVRLGAFLLPERRPMDNMKAGWTLPQEDEFALMNMGVPTPYLRIAFPQTQPRLLEYLTLQDVPEKKRELWFQRFEWFLKVLTYHYGGKQLVLKSPTHTGRLGELARRYPGCKFIHLTRNPAKLFSSTLRLWRSLDDVQALQESQSEEVMEQYVAECLRRMYDQFESDRASVESHRVTDLRYEDLVANPFESVQRLYEELELGDFDVAAEALKKRLEDHEKYQPNQHQISSRLREQVASMWPEYCRRYGYEVGPGNKATPNA